MKKLPLKITIWLKSNKENIYLFYGLLGSILATYGSVMILKTNVEGFWGLILLGVIVWAIVLWRLVKTKTIFAFVFFTLITIGGGLIDWAMWKPPFKVDDKKLIILVAEFDGPEEIYGFRNQIIEQLEKNKQEYNDIVILVSSQMITPEQGSQGAIKLGEKENADLVIWAWYRPTENPNIIIHFENLSPTKLSVLNTNTTYRPQATLSDLDSFKLQTKIGDETSSFILFLTGYIRYQENNCLDAINLFSNALAQAKQTTSLVDTATLYFYRGSCYNELADYSNAIEDFSLAIQMNPTFSNAYLGRGVTLSNLGQYDRAIHDYNEAIKIDPDLSNAYLNRGLAYYATGSFEYAVSDFDKAITLNPGYAEAYLARGITYNNLQNFSRAIQDFSQAINIDPNYASAYLNRAETYQALGKTAEAEADFKKYEELTGKKP